MATPPDNRIDLVVIVSGSPQPVDVNPHQRLEHLVREALRKSGNVGQPPEEWELRLPDGTPMDLSQTVGAAGLVDGMTLTLQPRAAAGG